MENEVFQNLLFAKVGEISESDHSGPLSYGLFKKMKNAKVEFALDFDLSKS